MKKIFLLLILIVLTKTTFAYLIIEDGQSHIINDNAYENTWVYLDRTKVNSPGTNFDLISGGKIRLLRTYNYSSISMSGGEISYTLEGYDHSKINISDGKVSFQLKVKDYCNAIITGGAIQSMMTDRVSNTTFSGGEITDFIASSNSSYINMTGGSCLGFVVATGNSIINLSGGTIGSYIAAQEYGKIYLNALNIEVNGYHLSYGDMLSNYGTLIENRPNGLIQDYWSINVTGKLIDGSIINNEFRVYNTGQFEGSAEIIVIPEPTTIALFACGSIFLRRKS